MAILIGWFTSTFFLCESQILYCVAKAKDSHLRNDLEVNSLSLLLNFIARKSFMLKVLIQIHQILKTSSNGYILFI